MTGNVLLRPACHGAEGIDVSNLPAASISFESLEGNTPLCRHSSGAISARLITTNDATSWPDLKEGMKKTMYMFQRNARKYVNMT